MLNKNKVEVEIEFMVWATCPVCKELFDIFDMSQGQGQEGYEGSKESFK